MPSRKCYNIASAAGGGLDKIQTQRWLVLAGFESFCINQVEVIMSVGSSALLIIDTQMAFFQAPKPLYQADRMLENMRHLITKAREAHVPVIYVQHNASSDLEWMNSTPLKDIHPQIAPGPSDLVLQKWQPDIFAEELLQHELTARGITNLVITGCQTEYCINNSCRSRAALGYDITLVSDAHATFDTDTTTANQIVEQYSKDLATIVTVKPTYEVDF